MRRVLIDTNIYSEFKKNNNRIVEALRYCDFIGLDVTVLAELYSGFKAGSREKQNMRELEEFCNSSRVFILPHDDNTAEFYANIFIALKFKGTPIPSNDIWIAACALQNGLALFSLDTHFKNIDTLLIKNDY
ncbi:MAG: type II toxin-antitoxin system VapC family toxin [Spirochaetales bacterium]|nr:type II toxin-antitoxin system VapC family toxin [Spirochaetales bacterium]